MGHRPREGRYHEREPLGDASGVDTRTVQGDSGLLGHRVEPGPLLGRRVEPAQRGDHVLAGSQDGGDHAGVGHEGAVEDAVRLEGQQGFHVASGTDANRRPAHQAPEVDALLGRAVDPGPDQFEVRVVEDTPHGGPTHAAGGPLHNPVGHVTPGPRLGPERFILRHPRTTAGPGEPPALPGPSGRRAASPVPRAPVAGAAARTRPSRPRPK